MTEGLDLDRLLGPLAEGGAGPDLRGGGHEGIFLRLKDLRSEARTAERDAVTAADSETPIIEAGLRAWAALAELAVEALEAVSKDLEVACWLCEAEARVHGFAGLARGLELLRRLVEDYWDKGLHPQEDEDGLLTRVAPVGGLLGLEGLASLLQPVRLLPLSDRAPEVALWTVEVAQAPLPGGDDANARERQQARRSEQTEKVRQGLLRASTDFLRGVVSDARSTVGRVEALSSLLDARAGVGRFGSQVTQPLETIIRLIEDHAGDRLVESVPTDAGLVGIGRAPDGAPITGGASARLSTRAEAYEAILRIADFFADTEPQSLVAKSLREVVRRAKLPLEALLAELLPDADQRILFMLRAGVKDDTSPNESASY